MEPTNMGRCMVGVPGLDQKRECFACNGDEPASFFFLQVELFWLWWSTCVLKQ